MKIIIIGAGTTAMAVADILVHDRNFIIAGFDNLSFCDTFTPELTSVSTDFDILGKRAIRTIENMVNDSNEIIRQFSMVPVEIIIRASTQS